MIRVTVTRRDGEPIDRLFWFWFRPRQRAAQFIINQLRDVDTQGIIVTRSPHDVVGFIVTWCRYLGNESTIVQFLRSERLAEALLVERKRRDGTERKSECFLAPMHGIGAMLVRDGDYRCREDSLNK